MKPSWKDAPDWAKWLACSWKGYWIWFSHKPQPRLKTQSWKVLDLLSHEAICAGLEYAESSPYQGWIESLEHRPIKAQEGK